MKKLFLSILAVFGLSAALALGAPGQSQAPSTDLEKNIVGALFSVPHYGVFDNLFFEVQGATVTLQGQAMLEITKAEAARRVAKVPGVGKVENKIEVLPPSPSDDALRMSLYRKIFGAPDLHRYSMSADPTVHIIVKGGHVTIVGMVSSAQDRQRVEMVAKEVPGMFSFKNELRLESNAQRPQR